MSRDGSDLAIIVPLWQRTAHIERVLTSIRHATPNASAMLVVSEGDEPVNAWIDQNPNVLYGSESWCGTLVVGGSGGGRGDYAAKINAGYRATTEPFLFTGADDLDFHPGWYKAAREQMSVTINEGDLNASTHTVGVVGTVDLCNDRTMRGEHSTHSLVARWYADCCAVVDQPGAIYHESYYHEFCDDELVGYAMSKGAYAHAFDSVVEHLHVNVAKSPDDVTYQRGRAMSRSSRRTFTTRRRLWEPR